MGGVAQESSLELWSWAGVQGGVWNRPQQLCPCSIPHQDPAPPRPLVPAPAQPAPGPAHLNVQGGTLAQSSGGDLGSPGAEGGGGRLRKGRAPLAAERLPRPLALPA